MAVVVLLIATGLKVATSEEATARRTTSVPTTGGSTPPDADETTTTLDGTGAPPTEPPGAAGGPAGQPTGQPAAAGTGTHPCPVTQADIPGVPVVANPFDPAQADVTVAFTTGNERYVQPAFFTKDGGTGPGKWQVRFTPPHGGSWQWQASINAGGRSVTGPTQSFSCAEIPGAHGPVRVSRDDPRYLVRQDGAGFFGVGLNMAWYDKKRKLDSYDEWLAHAAANKVNFIRVWMPDWAFALEGTTRDANEAITGYVLGDYTLRLDRAAELDAVIAKAKEHGMVVMLTIQNHGPFSFIADSRWGENPYNKANGGPLAKPHDFYTDPVARDLFKRRLRYIVARWGYETNIIWELWNEVDLADRDPFADVVRWHAEMGDYLKAIDPIKHIVTTSLGGGLDDWTRPDPQWTALWQLPQIEVIQVHPYGEGAKRPVDFAHTITSQLQSMTKLNKPILVSETGINWHGPDETLQDDPDWQGLHEAIWAGAFGGGASSGMPWFWDLLIGKYQRYDLFVALGVLTDGIAMDAEHFAFDGATATSATRKLQALPLRGRNHTLVWVRNGPSWWFKPDPTVISDGQLSLGQLPNGTYRVRAIATKDGAVTDLGTRTVEVGQTTIDLPPFGTDIAIRLDRRS